MNKRSYYPPTKEEIIGLRKVSNRSEVADVALRGGKVLHVHTGEFREADILLRGRHIAAVTDPGQLEAVQERDITGSYVVPTFIESHLHIEYTMLTPGELARLVVPKGTTTVLADPNCIANVNGLEGIEYIRQTKTPFRIFLQASSAVPRTPDLELGGAVLTSDDIKNLLTQPDVVSLGESNPYSIDETSADLLAAMLAEGKRANGHTARLSGTPLWTYIAGGIGDDHNAANVDEVLELIRLGLGVAIQAGSMTDYVKDILGKPELLGSAAYHIFFGADDKHVGDLAEQGHIDHHVRSAVKLGVDPALAIRMATLNPAIHFKIDHLIGSITPSKLADFQILPDLTSFEPTSVFVGGEEVARDGKAIFTEVDDIPAITKQTVKLGAKFDSDVIAIRSKQSDHQQAKVYVAEMYNGYYKRKLEVELQVKEGCIKQDPKLDIAKIAVIDRHHGSGKAGIGFVKGFGLRRGAIAATNNCENQNLVAIGTTDEDIILAAKTLEEIGGGYVVVADGEVIETLPLSVAGIMSDQPWETVLAQLHSINQAAKDIGCIIESPFMILAFVGLAGVPDLGLTELGLIDVETQEFISTIIDGY